MCLKRTRRVAGVEGKPTRKVDMMVKNESSRDSDLNHVLLLKNRLKRFYVKAERKEEIEKGILLTENFSGCRFSIE